VRDAGRAEDPAGGGLDIGRAEAVEAGGGLQVVGGVPGGAGRGAAAGVEDAAAVGVGAVGVVLAGGLEAEGRGDGPARALHQAQGVVRIAG